MKTIRRNPASTVVWLVVLFLFISSSGCALLKQSENEIPLSNFDRERYYGQLPGSNKPLPTESNKPLKSLYIKKWLNLGFCLATQYIVYILVPDTKYRYICGVGAIHKGRLKVVF